MNNCLLFSGNLSLGANFELSRNSSLESREGGIIVENLDAFLYIIVVLCFYALSILLLMVKYIRKEKEDRSWDYFYNEFVEREQFQCPQFKNKMAVNVITSTDVFKKSTNLMRTTIPTIETMT